MESDAGFDEVASALYAVPPSEFVKARDERARQAKAEGDSALAQRLKALRRPTQSAWWVDKIVREHTELFERVRELGAEYRAPGLTATRLRELAAARQQLLGQIAATVDADVSGETRREIESTFVAVLADPEAERAASTARLDKPLSYAGFGATPLSLAPEPAGAKAEKGTKKSTRTAAKAEGSEARAERTPTPSALREFEEADRSWRDAVAERDAVREEVDRLKAQLRDADNRLAAAERGVRLAKKRRDRARASV